MTPEATYRWFGRDWGAPANEPELQIPVPAGETCRDCQRPILDSDSGVRVPHITRTGALEFSYFHTACFLRSVGIDIVPSF